MAQLPRVPATPSSSAAPTTDSSLLLVDEFGLHRLSRQQSEDLCALILERHRHASFVVTSNRDGSEWVRLFADPILANSALDRLANVAISWSSTAPATAPNWLPARF